MCLIDLNVSRNAKITYHMNGAAANPVVIPANPDRIALYVLSVNSGDQSYITVADQNGVPSTMGSNGSIQNPNSLTYTTHPGIVSGPLLAFGPGTPIAGWVEVILDAVMSNAVQNVVSLTKG